MFGVGASNTTRNPLCPLDFYLQIDLVHFELESTGATRSMPGIGMVNIYGSRLPRWHRVGRQGEGVVVLDPELTEVKLTSTINTGWL